MKRPAVILIGLSCSSFSPYIPPSVSFLSSSFSSFPFSRPTQPTENKTPARQEFLKQRAQRVQSGGLGGRAERAAAGASASPVEDLEAVRVTVTATNGIKNAHVNEIRLYEAEGEAPFPVKP